MTNEEDIYNKYIRTSEEITIKVKRFRFDGLPVCLAWYGDEKHERMMCPFMLTRHFGTVDVCGFNGKDLSHYYDSGYGDIPKPHYDCPLWEGVEIEE